MSIVSIDSSGFQNLILLDSDFPVHEQLVGSYKSTPCFDRADHICTQPICQHTIGPSSYTEDIL